ADDRRAWAEGRQGRIPGKDGHCSYGGAGGSGGRNAEVAGRGLTRSSVEIGYMGLAALASGVGLETPRLILRQFREQDVEPLAAMYADPETMRYLGTGVTFSRGETWRAISSML